MKNTAAYYQNEQAKKNGGCGRVMFQRTPEGLPRVCGITGQCQLCQQKTQKR
jgi:hypothetical protein